LWMGVIGFIDDYIKKFKNDKQGLPGKFKVIGQIGLGIFVGATMYFHPDIVVQHSTTSPGIETEIIAKGSENKFYVKDKAMLTTIPFVKENEFNYYELISWVCDNYKSYV